MSQQPLISVVIPVFNGERYLSSTLESVFSQTYRNLEIIAVDDGSTDRSLTILQDLGDRIVAVSQQNSGVGAARNRGMELAQGSYIAFLDQDDWWCPRKLELQAEVFWQSPGIVLVHTEVSYYDTDGERFVGPLNKKARRELIVGECRDKLLMENWICNSSVAVRKSALDSVGGCDDKIRGNTVQDYDLWIRLSEVGQFGFVPSKETVFRLHAGQGHRARSFLLEEELKVLLKHRTEKEWRSRPEWKRRMTQVCDELATSLWEEGELTSARARFREALSYSATPRQLSRALISHLPRGLAESIRQLKQS